MVGPGGLGLSSSAHKISGGACVPECNIYLFGAIVGGIPVPSIGDSRTVISQHSAMMVILIWKL